MNPKRKSAKELQSEIDNFNSLHPVGYEVSLKLDTGEVQTVYVKHKATLLGGHTAVG